MSFTYDNMSNKKMDSNVIKNATKTYLESNLSDKDKELFLKLKRLYLMVKDIPNYQAIQEDLYAGKSIVDIIIFELARITECEKADSLILSKVDEIKNIIASEQKQLSDELYAKIIKLIIRIEISLGIKVGLFNELCCYFEDMVENAEENVSRTSLIYTKRI